MALSGRVILTLVGVGVAGATAFALLGGGDPTALPRPDASRFEPQVAAALSEAREAVAREPGSASAWGRYGMVLDAHDLVGDAARCYRVAEGLDASDFRWPYMLGLCLPDAEPAEAIAAFERARALRPDYAPVHLRLGRLYLWLPDGRERARAAFEAARRLAPPSSHALWGLARIALDEGDSRQARGLLEEAARLAPAHREVHALLAEVLARLGDPRGAEEARRKADAQTGAFPIPDPARSQVLSLAVGSGSLLAQARQALAAGRADVAADRLGRVAQAMRAVLHERPAEPFARDRLAQALAMHAWMLATSASERVRDGGKALELAQELIGLAPEEPEALAVLAAAQAENGAFEGAVRTLSRAIAIATARGERAFAAEARLRLDAYRQGRPWHQPR